MGAATIYRYTCDGGCNTVVDSDQSGPRPEGWLLVRTNIIPIANGGGSHPSSDGHAFACSAACARVIAVREVDARLKALETARRVTIADA